MFFTPSLNVGGLERILLTYAQGLAIKGYDVSYVLCHDNGTFTQELLKNIKVINLKSLRLRKSIVKLAHIIRIYRPEIIITANDATLVVLLAKWLSGVRLKVITSQHSYITDKESNTLRSKLIIRSCFHHCFKVIAVSKGIRKMLTEDLGLSYKKVQLVYNPIDIHRIIHLSETPCQEVGDYMVFVGRLSPVKNLSLLLRAFNRFSEQFPDSKLVFVGDGIERDKLLQDVKQLNLQSKVIFAGIQANPYPYMKNAKVVVLPSLSEAFPTVLLESLTLGKTIVSTPTIGANEILGERGLGYISNDFHSDENFAILLKQAWLYPIAPDLLKKEAWKYGWEKKINELEELWNTTNTCVG